MKWLRFYHSEKFEKKMKEYCIKNDMTVSDLVRKALDTAIILREKRPDKNAIDCD